MKCYTSFKELDTLGAALAKEYIKSTHRWNSFCFDIEGFITDFIHINITYANFAEDDPSKIGFFSNGLTPLMVYKNKTPTSVVFPINTIVLENYLKRNDQSARRRFTLGHEAAHYLLQKHVPMQMVSCFHSEFDSKLDYDPKEMKQMLSMTEAQANRLAAALLMPDFLMGRQINKYNDGKNIICYDGGVFAQEDKIKMQNMADNLGVSYSAFVSRLMELELIEYHPIEEYIDKLELTGIKNATTIFTSM